MEETEVLKKKEIEELKNTINKTQKEKEMVKRKMESEEIKIKAVISKLNKELSNNNETLGKNIKLLSISIQQKEADLQVIHQSLKSASNQYTNAIESYEFAQSALNSRDLNLPFKIEQVAIGPETVYKTHVRCSTKAAESIDVAHGYNKSISDAMGIARNDNLKGMNDKDYAYKLGLKSRSKRNSSLSKSNRGNTKSVSNVSYLSTAYNASCSKYQQE
jgi:hypothetical protein